MVVRKVDSPAVLMVAMLVDEMADCLAVNSVELMVLQLVVMRADSLVGTSAVETAALWVD